MPIKKVEIPAGVDRESTQQSSGPYWYDANNVRFRDRFAQSIGGWADSGVGDLKGIVRCMHSWTDFNGNQYQIVGTMWKFYIIVGNIATDITPYRKTVDLGSNWNMDASQSLVVVDDMGHGLSINDFVRVQTMASDIGGGGEVTAESLLAMQEGLQVLSVTDDQWTYQANIDASTGTTSGGGASTAAYLVPSGQMAAASGTGWGVGTWGGDDYLPTVHDLQSPYVTTVTSSNQITLGTNGAFVFEVNDYIYVYGCTGSAGTFRTDYLNNKWWLVTSISGGLDAVITLDYTVTTGGTNGGAASKFYAYDLTDDAVEGAIRGWDQASESSVSLGSMRTISIDNFGEDCIVANRGGPLYYYDTSFNVSSGVPVDTLPLVEINETTFTGASNPPTALDSFIVSQGHGHVVAFGPNDIGATNQNKMLVRWSDRHNPFTWTPSASGEAGGDVLRSGSHIMMGVSTKDEIVIFTDTSVYSMRYVGFPEVYGIQLISAGSAAYSRQSCIAVDNSVYYMGNEEFYVYNGSVQSLPKNLSNYVFDNLNSDQKDKVFAGVNSAWTEVMWFYPDGNSFECNRYVSFNYANGTWSMGSYDMESLSEGSGSALSDDLTTYENTNLNRTAWEDSSVLPKPRAAYIKRYDPAPEPDATFGQQPEIQTARIMDQETGTSALPSKNNPDSNLNAYVESGEVDLDDGYHYAFYDKLIPDVQLFDLDGAPSASLTASMQGRDLPGKAQKAASSITIDSFDPPEGPATSYSPDFNATTIRGRARSVSIRIESTGAGFSWRTGTMRIRVRPDGKD